MSTMVSTRMPTKDGREIYHYPEAFRRNGKEWFRSGKILIHAATRELVAEYTRRYILDAGTGDLVSAMAGEERCWRTISGIVYSDKSL